MKLQHNGCVHTSSSSDNQTAVFQLGVHSDEEGATLQSNICCLGNDIGLRMVFSNTLQTALALTQH